MPITTCTRCGQLYIERSEEAANESDRKCPTCFKGGAAAFGLAPLCSPIVDGYARGKSGLDDDMLDHLVELGDNAEGVMRQEARLRALEAAANALVKALLALGLGDDSAEVSGADAVDVVNAHLPALRNALAH